MSGKIFSIFQHQTLMNKFICCQASTFSFLWDLLYVNFSALLKMVLQRTNAATENWTKYKQGIVIFLKLFYGNLLTSRQLFVAISNEEIKASENVLAINWQTAFKGVLRNIDNTKGSLVVEISLT